MSNAEDNVHLVYNGEVYNFRQLRVELEKAGREFTTKCDAEVVLAAYERWGIDCFRVSTACGHLPSSTSARPTIASCSAVTISASSRSTEQRRAGVTSSPLRSRHCWRLPS